MSITQGLIYASSSTVDPSSQGGFNGGGNVWAQTDTGDWYVRNSTNTAWTIWGHGDQQSLGMYPLSGGAGGGLLTGNTGLMTSNGATPFASSPTVTNRNTQVAALSDISTLQNTLFSLIEEIVSQTVSTITPLSLGPNIVIAFGVLTPSPYNQIMFLPFSGLIYSDGTSVKSSDCRGFASLNFSPLDLDYASGVLQKNDNQGMSWQAYRASEGFSINYQIIAIRPNT
jgi:hypothetical protein